MKLKQSLMLKRSDNRKSMLLTTLAITMISPPPVLSRRNHLLQTPAYPERVTKFQHQNTNSVTYYVGDILPPAWNSEYLYSDKFVQNLPYTSLSEHSQWKSCDDLLNLQKNKSKYTNSTLIWFTRSCNLPRLSYQ